MPRAGLVRLAGRFEPHGFIVRFLIHQQLVNFTKSTSPLSCIKAINQWLSDRYDLARIL